MKARLLAREVVSEPTTSIERAKKAAAYQAVDEFVSSGMIVGVGSGSTIVYGIQRLAERVQNEHLEIVCVPTSFQSRNVS